MGKVAGWGDETLMANRSSYLRSYAFGQIRVVA